MTAKSRASAGPAPDDVAQGTQFFSLIDPRTRGDPGTIADHTDSTRWHYAVDPHWSDVFPLTLLHNPDFIVRLPGGEEVVRIRRVGRLGPSFALVENGQTVGRIRFGSPIRTRSTLELPGGNTWSFRQGLFTVRFYGDSDRGERLWVLVGPSKRRWNMLLPPGTKDVYLPAVLAFLHREYWRH